MKVGDELIEIGIFASFVLFLLFVAYAAEKAISGFLKSPAKGGPSGISDTLSQAVSDAAAGIGNGIEKAGSGIGTTAANTAVNTVTGVTNAIGKKTGNGIWDTLTNWFPSLADTSADPSELNWQNYHPFTPNPFTGKYVTDVETTSLPDYSSVPYINDEPVDLLDIQGQPLGV